ncbi:hypothetical protein ERJ75_001324400 [Trypanosoma vivax]|nr:hypothetical protein TRVL_04217 [Trypanosoma vivax]KAH8607835.1 hypothetical protein ERJ75_001324400 [Trypanosoma vivax]
MRGHQHFGDSSLTQNQGNVLGDRPCVRQSRLYREHNGGNTMKELMGQSDLKWDTTCTQGAYAGGKAYDCGVSYRENGKSSRSAGSTPPPQQVVAMSKPNGSCATALEGAEVVISMDEVAPRWSEREVSSGARAGQRHDMPTWKPVASRAFRPGSGYANRQTYNIFTGE